MNNTDIRTKALEWWKDVHAYQKVSLMNKCNIAPFVGISQLSNEDVVLIYRTEHGIEDEVKTETLEDAAKMFLKKLDDESGTMWTEDDEQIVKSFVSFATQQKEQDKAIIQELLQTLKEIDDFDNKLNIYTDRQLIRYVKEISKAAITKAEQYLK